MLPAFPTPPVRDSRTVAFIISLDRGIYTVARSWLLVVNAILFAWVALTMLAPVLLAAGYAAPSRLIYAMFQPFCHQRPDRSFFILGEKMACCERCAAIYGGLFLFGLGYVALGALRPLAWRWVAVCSLPILVDAATQAAGWRESSALWRVVTGAVFAVGVAWIFFPFLDRGFADMRSQLEQRFARLVGQGRARPLRGAPPPSAA